MRTLICDSSAWIELEKYDLLAKTVDTDLEIAVPDLLLSQKFVSIGCYNLQEPDDCPFRVCRLDPEGVAMSSRFRSTNPALSVLDSFAVAIAKQEDRCLLTVDKAVQTAARTSGVRHRNVLWLVDRLDCLCALSRSEMVYVFQAMLNEPRSTVSQGEIRSRLVNIKARVS